MTSNSDVDEVELGMKWPYHFLAFHRSLSLYLFRMFLIYVKHKIKLTLSNHESVAIPNRSLIWYTFDK